MIHLRRRLVLSAAGAALAATAAVTAVFAQAPGPPDYFWPYGLAQQGGENISPSVQPVLGMVNGKVCGIGETLIATAGENTPDSDVGRTVYTIDILANGSRADQLPGCGEPGDTVVLYFPVLGRMAVQRPEFQQGGLRVDLELGTNLQHRAIVPLSARDSAGQ